MGAEIGNWRRRLRRRRRLRSSNERTQATSSNEAEPPRGCIPAILVLAVFTHSPTLLEISAILAQNPSCFINGPVKMKFSNLMGLNNFFEMGFARNSEWRISIMGLYNNKFLPSLYHRPGFI